MLDSDLAARIGKDVERSILRARNGVRYAAAMARPREGATPKDVIWNRGRAALWRYRGGAIRYDPPIVIVHSLVSRSYILDLRPGASSVGFLVDQGFDVLMLDWGVPDSRDAEHGFETYVDEYIPRAIAAARKATGAEELTLAGYCLGGILAALYAAAYEDARIRNLVLLATPVDFAEMGAMVAAVREGRLGTEDLLDETGNVPADGAVLGFLHAGADEGDRRVRDRCSSTFGTTSSSTATRRWRSGLEITCRCRARQRGRSSTT